MSLRFSSKRRGTKNSNYPTGTIHWSDVSRSAINYGFNGKSHYKLFAIFLSNGIFFSVNFAIHSQLRPQRFAMKKARKAFKKRLKFTIGLFQRKATSMQSNFNSLQNILPSVRAKMRRAIILTVKKWSLAHHVQIICLPLISCEMTTLCFNKRTDNSLLD